MLWRIQLCGGVNKRKTKSIRHVENVTNAYFLWGFIAFNRNIQDLSMGIVHSGAGSKGRG